MSEKEFLNQVVAFTQLPAVHEIIVSSRNYGLFLKEIAKKQGLSTTKLKDENIEEFSEKLERETRYIKKIYSDLEILSLQAGFSKEKINRYFSDKKIENIGAIALVRQFFAMVRNKESKLNDEQTLQQRIDDMLGFEAHIKKMIHLIKIY